MFTWDMNEHSVINCNGIHY